MSQTSAPSALADQPRAGSNLPEFTVSEISLQLKRTVEERFALVRVRGEIGACKTHSSGHVYLTLKDEKSVLDGVIWKGGAGRLGLRPEIGMEVVCTGRLTIYAGQSKYQLVIEQITLAGEGALLKLIEDRKKRLAAEGLFAPERKRVLPFMPRRIGVVTSPTGAVIRDILHRIEDRFPCHVVIWPVAVQGQGAAEQIAAAIAGFNALPENSPLRPDVLIVARGGGSLEDLMPFNEEIVVRAAAASRIPLIAAVGHETDTTLIDYAADRRAPTPSAAAEISVPVRADLLGALADWEARLRLAWRRNIELRRERAAMLARALGDPRRMLEPLWQRLDDRGARLHGAARQLSAMRGAALQAAAGRLLHPRELLRLASERLNSETRALDAALRQRLQLFFEQQRRLPELAARFERAYSRRLEYWRQHLQQVGQLLLSLSPQSVLERGYVLVRTADGVAVTDIAAAKQGRNVTLRFHDGETGAKITGGRDDRQGKLL